MTEKLKRFTRRKFIDRAAKGAAGLVGYSLLKTPFGKAARGSVDKSMVVVVKDDNASIEYEGEEQVWRVDQEVVQVMMDAGICRLTGIEDIGEAWKSLFPGITQDKVISIKVNCLFAVATHPEVTYCVVNGLTSMQVDGGSFPLENIIIWDRRDSHLSSAGYFINTEDTGVKCYGTNTSYSTRFDVAGRYQYLSRILTHETDYMINLSILKNHGIAGVTLSLKNHYGSCNDPGALHGGDCNPYIPALNALPDIKNKQVICICDAVYAIISGGTNWPWPQVIPNSLILSRDSVAHDYIGAKMLKDYGMSDASLNQAVHIATAAQDPYNLGTNDLPQIDLINIENPTSVIDTTRMNNHTQKIFAYFKITPILLTHKPPCHINCLSPLK